MANKFDITISAVDKATATVRKINANMAKITAPMDKLKRSVGVLGREVGLQRFGKQLGKTARHARDLRDRLGAIASPMAAVVGAASLGGVVALATEWGKLGWEVQRTARTLGISTSNLQGLEGAAQAAGLSTQSMVSGLSSFSHILQGATFGRNNGAMRMLNRLGITIHRTANGTVKTTQAFMDLSRVIRKYNPNAQRTIAGELGVGRLLPLLRKGPKAIEAYERKMRSLGAIQSGPALESAHKFAQSLVWLRASVTGVWNALAQKLIPTLTPLVDKLTKWIAANRQIIASTIIKDVKQFAENVQAAVKWMGGWKNVAIAVGAIMAGPLLSSVVSLVGAIAQIGKIVLIENPILAAVAAISVAAYELYKHWDSIANWWHRMWGGMGDDVRRNASVITRAFGSQNMEGPLPAGVGGAALMAPASAQSLAPALSTLMKFGGSLPPVPAAGGGNVNVTVHFENAPPGTKATVKGSGATNVDGPRISHARPTMINQ